MVAVGCWSHHPFRRVPGRRLIDTGPANTRGARLPRIRPGNCDLRASIEGAALRIPHARDSSACIVAVCINAAARGRPIFNRLPDRAAKNQRSVQRQLSCRRRVNCTRNFGPPIARLLPVLSRTLITTPLGKHKGTPGILLRTAPAFCRLYLYRRGFRIAPGESSMSEPGPFNRVVLVVLDSVGIGEMPDASDYGDAGADTLGHTLGSRDVLIPNLRRMGLANIRPLPIDPVSDPAGAFGRAATRSHGKDTTTGHWEMGGIVTEIPFPTYPNGFPPRI